MTTQTLNAKSPLVEANEDPSIHNFKYLYTTNKVDVMSDVLANIVIDEFNTDFYRLLSDSDKQLVQESFNSKLSAHNVVIDEETITMCENQGMLVLASILRTYNVQTSSFGEVVEVLQPSTKVTIIKFSDFGFPIAIQTVIDSVEVKPYAQYDKTLFIVHKPKGKRKLWEDIIRPFQAIIVYNGWINADIDKLTKTVVSSNSNVTVTKSNYVSFDKNYMTDLLKGIKETPLVTFNV